MDSQLFGPRPEHGEQPIPTKHERDEYHDFLETFMSSPLYDEVPEETQNAIAICRDVLCWTLGHENGSFELNIESWSEYFKDRFGLSDTFYN